MPTLKTYQLTVSNFIGITPCSGYYIYTGLTSNIDDADYINGSPVLIPIPPMGYSFFVDVDLSLTNIYLFVEHCDGHNNSNINQGGYQMSYVDLRCSDCNTGTTICDCVLVDSSLVSGATGNTNPSYNNVVEINYTDCYGAPQTYYQTALVAIYLCTQSGVINSVSFWNNNTQYTSTTFPWTPISPFTIGYTTNGTCTGNGDCP
jgi:hypothetical protein